MLYTDTQLQDMLYTDTQLQDMLYTDTPTAHSVLATAR
jgi:hypothetical protein